MIDDFNRVFEGVKKVLVFTAHPDDMDIMMGGTVARLEKEGREVMLVVCTNGALGSKQNKIDLDELAKTRNGEQKNSAKKLGMKEENVVFLDNFDCTLKPDDNEFIERVVYHMRKFRPDFLITHDPLTTIKSGHPNGLFSVNHRDHRAVGGAVVNALMPMARDISFFPEHKLNGLDGIIVKKLMVDAMDNETATIDFTEFKSQKRLALEQHVSQLNEKEIEHLTERHIVDGRYYEFFRYYEMSY
ncbi:PIG-L family deacetylase [Candidatus Dojkabacteria bacterium]|nr:PIG-L family deacetylase [Candidatus Dojkabacteria bacterium]